MENGDSISSIGKFDKIKFEEQGSLAENYVFNISKVDQNYSELDLTLNTQENYVGGLQTPKFQHFETELWIPLHFWFSRNVEYAVPEHLLPVGNRFITLDINSSEKLFEEFPVNTIEQYKINSEENFKENSLIDKIPVNIFGGINKPSLMLEMYVNSFYIDSCTKEVLFDKMKFILIRSFRNQSTITNSQSRLNQLRWPIEYMILGFQPLINENNHEDWWRQSINIKSGEYKIMLPTISHLYITAHDVRIKQTPAKIFSDYKYLKFFRNMENIYIINFSVLPEEMEPSGHLNLEKITDFKLAWETAFSVLKLNVCATSINFLNIGGRLEFS